MNRHHEYREIQLQRDDARWVTERGRKVYIALRYFGDNLFLFDARGPDREVLIESIDSSITNNKLTIVFTI